jgi:membrane-associated phospholipid phosphatase
VFFLLLLKRKKTIESLHLKTIEERKFPILFFIILNLLLGIRLLEFKLINLLAITFIATAISLVIVFVLLYSKLKTSLHTLAIGGLVGFVIIVSIHFKIRLLLLISSMFLLFGVVSYSRIKLKAHTQVEIFLGFIIALIVQLVTYYVWNIL